MAVENHHNGLPGVVAAVDMSATNYRFVNISAADTVDLAGAGEVSVGVVFNCPEAGDAASLYGPGDLAKVEASAAIAAGARVGVAADGKARTAASGDYVMGQAVSAAGADGEILSVFLMPLGIEP